ncbi:hypothetical protein CMO89_01935 [Candidatus Woesearchaeota archaeon]|nr:hypothetical protein [Candidatus Woesearchaeota archaeon]|tara:strand:+ start:788 stop:1636 length:849 start_codon:yes stop_codon:yes gene_type:complete
MDSLEREVNKNIKIGRFRRLLLGGVMSVHLGLSFFGCEIGVFELIEPVIEEVSEEEELNQRLYFDENGNRIEFELLYNAEEGRYLNPRKDNSAVFLIDMQAYFLYGEEGVNPEELERELRNQIEVLDYCRIKDVPVIVFEYEDRGDTIEPLKSKLNELEDIHYIKKAYDNGWINTDLEEVIFMRGIINYIVMGVNSASCVALTAFGKWNADYEPGVGITGPGYEGETNVMASNQLMLNDARYKWDDTNIVRPYELHGFYKSDFRDLLRNISNPFFDEMIPVN